MDCQDKVGTRELIVVNASSRVTLFIPSLFINETVKGRG